MRWVVIATVAVLAASANLLFAGLALAEDLGGRVVKVSDGDTLTVLGYFAKVMSTGRFGK